MSTESNQFLGMVGKAGILSGIDENVPVELDAYKLLLDDICKKAIAYTRDHSDEHLIELREVVDKAIAWQNLSKNAVEINYSVKVDENGKLTINLSEGDE